MRFYELTPVGERAKSFYGKARIEETNSGEKILHSYDTAVCKLDSNGNFIRLWNGYSATTMRHVNSFLHLFSVPGGGKTWWNKQEVG